MTGKRSIAARRGHGAWPVALDLKRPRNRKRAYYYDRTNEQSE